MQDLDLPPPDLFIAALGRSGSTLLANLLTTPPDRWLLVEPRFADASTGRDVLAQAAAFGMSVAPDEWLPRPAETPQGRIVRVFGERLRSLRRWGLKEVRPNLLEPTLKRLRPKRVVVLVRDLRDVALSLYEKTLREAHPDRGDAWLRGYLTEAPTGVLALADAAPDPNRRIVRYEDLVADEGYRRDLGAWLDWPLDGRPDRNLADLFGRGREVALHDGAVTKRSLHRHGGAELSAAARDLVEWAHARFPDFQRRFGYD
jgi:hypothetical protein